VSHPDRAVRASDAEREDVSRQLSAHAAAGRLTPQELDERLDAAYAARTYGELTRLLEDLPAAPAAPAEDPARAVARTRLAHRAGAAAIASRLRGPPAGHRQRPRSRPRAGHRDSPLPRCGSKRASPHPRRSADNPRGRLH
jgi:crotonobetainyl-CoA:carnitine CoA-transferase CaiB-like acyl-CoA transferase